MTGVDTLPLICRIRGHGWKPRAFWPGWTRKTCKRCYRLNPPHPTTHAEDTEATTKETDRG